MAGFMAMFGSEYTIGLENILDSKVVYSRVNKAMVSGKIESDFQYSHEFMGTKYYKTRVMVKRFSGVYDYIPVMVSNTLLENALIMPKKGKYIEVAGRYNTYYNKVMKSDKAIEQFVFATTFNVYENESELEVANANLVYIEGKICKGPNFRETPLGRRISEIMIKVNSTYYKTDYIFCIGWENLESFLSECKLGDKVKIYGRIQSREYFKRYSEDTQETKVITTYEVSIFKIDKICEEVCDGVK